MTRDVRRPGRRDDDRRTPRRRRSSTATVSEAASAVTRTERALDRREQIHGGGRIVTRLLGERVDTDHT